MNIVAQAVTANSTVPFVSLCEGPIYYPAEAALAAGLDPALLDVRSIGLNHASWSIRHQYDGAGPHAHCWRRRGIAAATTPPRNRHSADARAGVTIGSIPSEYMQYYFFTDEVLAELQAKATTRAQDILVMGARLLGALPRAGRNATAPSSTPLARAAESTSWSWPSTSWTPSSTTARDLLPVNVPNRGAIPDLPDDLVVETLGYVDAAGITPLALGPCRGR